MNKSSHVIFHKSSHVIFHKSSHVCPWYVARPVRTVSSVSIAMIHSPDSVVIIFPSSVDRYFLHTGSRQYIDVVTVCLGVRIINLVYENSYHLQDYFFFLDLQGIFYRVIKLVFYSSILQQSFYDLLCNGKINESYLRML